MKICIIYFVLTSFVAILNGAVIPSLNATLEVLPPPCKESCLDDCTENCQPEGTNCPEGYYMNENGICIQTVTPDCPSGTTQVGGACVEIVTEQPICPIGFHMENNKCIRVTTVICPRGTYLKDGVCVRQKITIPECPPGYYHQYGQCVKTQCPNNRCNSIVENSPCHWSCPQGYNLINGLCHAQQTQQLCGSCPQSQYSVTPTRNCPIQRQCNSCGSQQLCPAGYQFLNGECIPQTYY